MAVTTTEDLDAFVLPPDTNTQEIFKKFLVHFPNIPKTNLRDQVAFLMLYIDKYDDIYDDINERHRKLKAAYRKLEDRCDLAEWKSDESDESTQTDNPIMDNATQTGVATMDSSTEMDQDSSAIPSTPPGVTSKRTSLTSENEDLSPSSTRPKKRQRKKSCPAPRAKLVKEVIPMETDLEPKAKSNPTRTSTMKNRKGQCYNCQHFGHMAATCTNPPRCVKCGLEHTSKSCVKPREAPPCCANCKAAHTASFRNCPRFKEYLKSIPKIKKPAQKNPRPSNHPKRKSDNAMTALQKLMSSFHQQMLLTMQELLK